MNAIPDEVLAAALKLHTDIMGTNVSADGVVEAIEYAYQAGLEASEVPALLDKKMVTGLFDLADVPLSELRAGMTDDLGEQVRQVLGQVERPRANLGSSGPPGRAD